MVAWASSGAAAVVSTAAASDSSASSSPQAAATTANAARTGSSQLRRVSLRMLGGGVHLPPRLGVGSPAAGIGLQHAAC